MKPEDITIINGVKLGTSLDQFHHQCDSLNISKKTVFTELFLWDYSEIAPNKIKVYMSDIFDLSDYRSPSTHHYGIFYPTTRTGTKNIIGLKVLLAYTGSTFLYTKNGIYDVTKETNIIGINQDVSDNLINEIGLMLSKKYGTPTDTVKSQYTNFYVFRENQIKEYYSDSLNISELIYWETKYLTIKLFKGRESKKTTFNMSEKIYSTTYENREIFFTKDEAPCHSFCYISYDLKEETIQNLGLDKLSL